MGKYNDIHKSVKESLNSCKNYRRDNNTCRTGCSKEGVKPSEECPFTDEQEYCRCYR
jgi:hypothetical protein